MIPVELNVGPYRYKVIENSHLLDEQTEDTDERVNGVHDPNRERIILREQLSGNVGRVTLFHECIHAALHAGNYTGRDEEKVVEALDKSLLALLDDNPELRRYLFGEGLRSAGRSSPSSWSATTPGL